MTDGIHLFSQLGLKMLDQQINSSLIQSAICFDPLSGIMTEEKVRRDRYQILNFVSTILVNTQKTVQKDFVNNFRLGNVVTTKLQLTERLSQLVSEYDDEWDRSAVQKACTKENKETPVVNSNISSLSM